MKKTKILAMILALIALVGGMVACDSSGDGEKAPEESVVLVPAGTDAQGNTVYETEIVAIPAEPSNPSNPSGVRRHKSLRMSRCSALKIITRA